MNDFEFFTGDREVDHFTLPLHKGKAQLTCRVFERWEERTSRSLNCGLRRRRTLKKTIGIATVEREELESTISGSFGLDGIAGFKSELRGKLSREVSFQETREEEEEFEFEAPKCGRRIVRVYQLVRIYQLSFKDFRSWLFRKGDLFKTVIEGVDRIYDRSIDIENDPDCGCQPKTAVGVDGFVNVALGKIAMLVGYKETRDGVELPKLGLLVRADNVNQLLFSRLALNAELVPAYLRFLADESSTVLEAQFLPESSLGNISEIESIESHSRRARRNRLLETIVLGSAGILGTLVVARKIQQRNEERELVERVESAAQRLSEATQRIIDARALLQEDKVSSSSAGRATANAEAAYRTDVE